MKMDLTFEEAKELIGAHLKRKYNRNFDLSLFINNAKAWLTVTGPEVIEGKEFPASETYRAFNVIEDIFAENDYGEANVSIDIVSEVVTVTFVKDFTKIDTGKKKKPN